MSKSAICSAAQAAARTEGLEIVTFGCRLNAYESEVMRSHARAAAQDDLVIVNTCAVTAEAERQARQSIRRARRQRPRARIVVTGCAAQIAPERFAAMPEVDRVLGNAEKLEATSWAEEGFSPVAGRIAVADIMTVEETAGHLIEGFEGRARAVVQVQTGCDHRCTFCIIPLGRGPSRSVPIGAVVGQVRTLVAAGYNEVVLSGVDIASYGGDLPGRPALGQMVRRLLAQVPELPRLRLSSLDPAAIDGDLWRMIAEEPRLMPHLHLSLQAGDDMVLKRMKRRHRRADAIALCDRARKLRPDIVFGADLIAGFPTETDTMAANTLEVIAACGLIYLHVFPYSARPGTPAARMPQVPASVRCERAARLRAAGETALSGYLQGQIGHDVEVLVERETAGRTEHFAPVDLDRPAVPGGLVRARLTAAANGRLAGTVVGG